MKPAMRVINWPDERLEGREEDEFTGGKTALSVSWLQEKDYRRGWRIEDCGWQEMRSRLRRGYGVVGRGQKAEALQNCCLTIS